MTVSFEHPADREQASAPRVRALEALLIERGVITSQTVYGAPVSRIRVSSSTRSNFLSVPMQTVLGMSRKLPRLFASNLIVVFC